MPKCICDIRPYSDDDEESFDDEIDEEQSIATGPYASLSFGVEHGGRYVMIASGEGEAFYYPKFCPECGRRLVD